MRKSLSYITLFALILCYNLAYGSDEPDCSQVEREKNKSEAIVYKFENSKDGTGYDAILISEKRDKSYRFRLKDEEIKGYFGRSDVGDKVVIEYDYEQILQNGICVSSDKPGNLIDVRILEFKTGLGIIEQYEQEKEKRFAEYRKAVGGITMAEQREINEKKKAQEQLEIQRKFDAQRERNLQKELAVQKENNIPVKVDTPQPSSLPAIKVSASILASDYANNELAADNKYRGKGDIIIYGTVYSVQRTLGQLQLVLEGRNFLSYVTICLENNQEYRASQLRKGQKATVRCKDVLNLVGFVGADECVFIDD